MPRPASGHLEAHEWADGRTVTYRCRVPYMGRQRRVVFGTNHEGWNEQRAQVELERIMGQIERGTWTPPESQPRSQPESHADPGVDFRAFLYRWWKAKKLELTDRGREDYLWRIGHLNAGPLAAAPVAAVDRQAVDAERTRLLEHGLGARSTNMVLMLLAQVLDDAVDYGLLDANPARGRKRRVKEPPKRRAWLEPDQALDLIDAAGELEQEARPSDRYGRRALVATLVLAGPRVSELLEVPRSGLDLHAGRLRLGRKTEAGTDRDIDLTWFLLGELRGWVASRDLRHDGPLFPTRTGRSHNAANVRRLLRQATVRANETRHQRGLMPIPAPTPHGCRRTFASLCFFAGRDVRQVMAWLGHSDPRMTLGVYAQTLGRRSVDRGLVWSLMRFADEAEFVPLNETMPESLHTKG